MAVYTIKELIYSQVVYIWCSETADQTDYRQSSGKINCTVNCVYYMYIPRSHVAPLDNKKSSFMQFSNHYNDHIMTKKL